LRLPRECMHGDNRRFWNGTSPLNTENHNIVERTTLIICALLALALPAFAGTEVYSNKSTQSVAPECPQWYADNSRADF
jgi:hypothetical protein